MKLLLKLAVNSLAVYVAARVIPGVEVETTIWTILLVAVVLGALNTFVKPLLIILTLPVTILTLGLFTLVINAMLVMATAYLVTGFTVSSFITAFLFSLVVTIVSSFLGILAK